MAEESTGRPPGSAQRPPRPPGTPPPLPWTRWAVGDRVVVRYRAADGIHDALGDLLEVGAAGVVVRTRRGDVSVHASQMITGKRVPPPPSAG